MIYNGKKVNLSISMKPLFVCPLFLFSKMIASVKRISDAWLRVSNNRGKKP